MRIFLIFSVVAALFAPESAWAGLSGPRQILSIGCHNTDNTCYITISGDPVGPATCSPTMIRWNESNDPNGKAILHLLTAAYLAGKPVDIFIDACYAPQPTDPTIQHFYLR
jgi:hypothetical protein